MGKRAQCGASEESPTVRSERPESGDQPSSGSTDGNSESTGQNDRSRSATFYDFKPGDTYHITFQPTAVYNTYRSETRVSTKSTLHGTATISSGDKDSRTGADDPTLCITVSGFIYGDRLGYIITLTADVAPEAQISESSGVGSEAG